MTIEIIDNPIAILNFSAVCPFGICLFCAGQEAVGFTLQVSGVPATYEYDWDGNGSFEESSSTPVTSHTFFTTGTFTPQARVSEGAQQDTASAGQTLQIIDCAQPSPSIAVSGSTALSINQGGTYTAVASNCRHRLTPTLMLAA